jgi:hypothetical protein
MIFTGRSMKGYVFVSEECLKSFKDFQYWIDLCLAFNIIAKKSIKKLKKNY